MNRERRPTRRKLRAALGDQAPAPFRMPPKAKACGKRRCDNYQHAITYLLWLSRKTRDPLRIYRCPECDGFHLTKRPTWKDDDPR